MEYTYKLQIITPSIKDALKVSKILGVEATHITNAYWELEITEKKSDPPIYFIDLFIDYLTGNYDELVKIGIVRDNISISMTYKYDQQCNMEFSPEEAKKVGRHGIKLGISCWKNS